MTRKVLYVAHPLGMTFRVDFLLNKGGVIAHTVKRVALRKILHRSFPVSYTHLTLPTKA